MTDKELTAAAVVEAARGWIGTPYAHQQMVKGRAVDCAGLVRGIGLELGVLEISEPAWRPYKNYRFEPRPRLLLEGLNRFLVRVPERQVAPGCVVLFALQAFELPQHLVIVSGPERIIHADSRDGRVVEQRFELSWLRQRKGVWRFPGVIYE